MPAPRFKSWGGRFSCHGMVNFVIPFHYQKENEEIALDVKLSLRRVDYVINAVRSLGMEPIQWNVDTSHTASSPWDARKDRVRRRRGIR